MKIKKKKEKNEVNIFVKQEISWLLSTSFDDDNSNNF